MVKKSNRKVANIKNSFMSDATLGEKLYQSNVALSAADYIRLHPQQCFPWEVCFCGLVTYYLHLYLSFVLIGLLSKASLALHFCIDFAAGCN